MRETGSAPEEEIGALVTQVARAFARDLQSRLHDYGVTPAQFCVLSCLWEQDGLSATALCEQAGFDAPTITGILDRLERQELVARRRGTGDRRVVTVWLTERGAALKQHLPRVASQSRSAMLAGFTSEETERLRGFLERLRNNL